MVVQILHTGTVYLDFMRLVTFPDDISLQTLDELYSFFDVEIIEFKYKKCVREAVDEIASEINAKEK